MYYNPKLVETPNRVSIWLNIAYEENNRVIGRYDHDRAETGSSTDEPRPLSELFAGHSYAKSWSPAAVAAAEKHGITEANECWMLFSHEYRVEPGPITDKAKLGVFRLPGAFYLGSFEY